MFQTGTISETNRTNGNPNCKKPRKRFKRMNSNLSGNEFFPSSCEFYVDIGGRLHQPSTLTQTFLIIITVVHILTFPVTAALNALVMIAVKMKPHLRSHKSNIGLSLLASTDFVVGIFVQPSFIALIITVLLDDISSTTCVLQALTRAMSCRRRFIYLFNPHGFD